MTTRSERKKAKFRFVLLYSVSLLLIFVLVSAFWRRLAPKEQHEIVSTSNEETWFLQTDTALHTKMEAMDGLAESYMKARAAGAQPDTSAWVRTRFLLTKTLDSIDQQAAYLSEGPKKTTMTSLSANFRSALAHRSAAVAGTVTPSTTPGSAAAQEMALLKQLLQEKDQTISDLQKQAQTAATTSGSSNAGLQATVLQKDKDIASLQVQVASLQNGLRQKEAALQTALASRPADNSGKDKTISALQGQVSTLQNQLRQKEADLRTASAVRPVVSAGGGEWQQKYQSLKSSFDKVSASEKSLKGAYQTLADDNRRLLSQLQSARKG